MSVSRLTRAAVTAAIVLVPVEKVRADDVSNVLNGINTGINILNMLNNTRGGGNAQPAPIRGGGTTHPRPTPYVEPTPRDPALLEAQTALGYLGYAVGRPDGRTGPRTRAAIQDYQASIGATPTGQLSPYERDRLMGDYLDARNGRRAAPVPTPMPPVNTAPTPPVNSQVVDNGGLDILDGDAAPVAVPMASYCEGVGLRTKTNGGFTTAETMTDPRFAMEEQFCNVRQYAVGAGQTLAGQTPDAKVAAACGKISAGLAKEVAALGTEGRDAAVASATAAIRASGSEPAKVARTARICLGEGYEHDDAGMSLASALALVAAGQPAYGEVIGHHLNEGFGVAENREAAGDWYELAFGALEAGGEPVFFPGSSAQRLALMRKALGGPAEVVQVSSSGAAPDSGLTFDDLGDDTN